MGCGSSTAVEPFKNPEENKNNKAEHKQQPNRKSSAASHKRKSSTSSSSSRKKPDADSRINSASTKKTYTIQRENSNTNEDICIKNDVVPVTNDENDDQFKHDELQKETFITGNYRRQEDVFGEVVVSTETREEKHERRAKELEEKFASLDYEEKEEEEIKELGLVQITIPPMNSEQEDKEYTIDDIVEHNTAAGFDEWFKYGKKLYNWSLMLPVIKDRMNDYAQKVYQNPASEHGYPIYLARRQGVTRKDLKLVLEYCYVGKVVDVSTDVHLERMKESCNYVLEECDGGEALADYKAQLNRWLKEYPNNPVYNPPLDPAKDPNSLEFPLSDEIRSDLTVLRKGIEGAFDTELPEDGLFDNSPNIYTEFGNEHEYFSTLVASHVDGSLPDLNMDIEGEVAWDQIQLELFKNDVTTEGQEKIWNKRANRTNIDDETWKQKRMDELYQSLVVRHEWDSSKVEPFKVFFGTLTQGWEAFLALCEQEFIPPVRNIPVENTNNVESRSKSAESKKSNILIEEDGNIDTGGVITTENETPRPKSRESIRSQLSVKSNTQASDKGSIARPKSEISYKSSASNDLTLVGTVVKDENVGDEDNIRPGSKESSRSDKVVDDSVVDNQTNGDDQMPSFEKMDSGLELDTPDHAEAEGRVSRENGSVGEGTQKIERRENGRVSSGNSNRYSDGGETPATTERESRTQSRYSDSEGTVQEQENTDAGTDPER